MRLFIIIIMHYVVSKFCSSFHRAEQVFCSLEAVLESNASSSYRSKNVLALALVVALINDDLQVAR